MVSFFYFFFLERMVSLCWMVSLCRMDSLFRMVMSRQVVVLSIGGGEEGVDGQLFVLSEKRHQLIPSNSQGLLMSGKGWLTLVEETARCFLKEFVPSIQ